MSIIIFDLDGTLMNTLDDLHNSVIHAMSTEGLPPLPKSDTRRYLGNGAKNLVYKSVEHVSPNAPEQQKARVLDAFRLHYAEHSMDNTGPYEGIMQMLKECKNRGYITAIVSNKPDFAVKDLHKAFFADYIDIAIGETPEVNRKPAPDMVDEAIRQLSHLHGRAISKSECVYVGDSEVDIATARNSGLPCIAVSWGFRDKDWLIECGAEHIIDHPQELL
ncbi:MAG: HAD-IA family hydrolase [Prevotellaceae bacterium]|nr:HAD-IA family hydrolase [Candidatus Minthosoma caballi]